VPLKHLPAGPRPRPPAPAPKTAAVERLYREGLGQDEIVRRGVASKALVLRVIGRLRASGAGRQPRAA
jgi:hypothetical protein